MQIGYDPGFLGLTAPLPTAEVATVVLDYQHFSVVFRPDRRLAAVSAVNIHGSLLREIDRKRDVWRLDPRLTPGQQLDNTLYDRNDFDRGHLTRRRDPGWGTAAEAKAANDATFHYTNAAPQAAGFNQSKQLWAGLEDYILEHAARYEQRLAVFTGPVFSPADPVYRGAQIPLRFFKIGVWLGDRELGAAGYILDQTRLVTRILAEPDDRARTAPPLGAYRTYQVPISDITTATGLTMPALVNADVLQPAPTAAAPGAAHWIELTTYSDVVL